MVDHFSYLPVEINYNIRRYLSLQDIYCLSQVSKRQQYYTKQEFVKPYTGIIYTGYNICLYSDVVMESVAKLLAPLLCFPLVTRYYKIIVSGHLLYNKKIGGKVRITMSPFKDAIPHSWVSNWLDDDIVSDIENNHPKQPLYFDYWLTALISGETKNKNLNINEIMKYDSTNSYHTNNNNFRDFKHKMVDELDLLMDTVEIDDSSFIKFDFDSCYGKISSIIYLKNVKQILYHEDYYNNIKIVTDGISYITSIVSHHDFEEYVVFNIYDNSILIHEYRSNHLVKNIRYTYRIGKLRRFTYKDECGYTQYDFDDQQPGCQAITFYPINGDSISLIIDDELKNKVYTLNDNHPYYNGCYSLLLPVTARRQRNKNNNDDEEFICPKIV
jgi:hypothetical protein